MMAMVRENRPVFNKAKTLWGRSMFGSFGGQAAAKSEYPANAWSSRERRLGTAAGIALTLSVCAASGAQAQCTGTGTLPGVGAALGITTLTNSIAGAANSTISTIGNMDTAFLAQGNAFVGSPKSEAPDFTASGVWVRGIGGYLNTTSTGTLGNVSIVGIPIPGTVSCNTSVHQDYAGVQFGYDLAKLNLGGSGENVHFGVTAGYASSDVTDNFGDSGTIQVPFIGAYSVLTYGRLFADFLTRFNFFENAITAPSIGISNQNFDASGISFSASVGYQFDLGHNWFFEPSLSVLHSTVRVDTLNIAGAGIVPSGFFAFDDIESTLGRAGARVGTSFETGGWALQPFVAASVWNEFEAPSTATFSAPLFIGVPGFPPLLNGTLSSTRIGTFGQYSAGLAAHILDTGWLGYIRVDYKDGEFVNGLGVNGGLRYQLDPVAMAAAPGVFKAPVYKAPAALPYVWTGFYGGAIVGAEAGETRWFFPAAATQTTPGVNGILGGAEIGYNQQIGSWVLGVEADAAWTNGNGAQSCPNGFFFTCHNAVDPLVTGTGRLGYAWNRTLFFVKGGVAWMDGSISATCNVPNGVPVFCNAQTQTLSESRVGGTVGAGVEFGLTANWSAKAEYDYLDFGTATLTFPSAGGVAAFPVQVREAINEVKIGVNYRFPVTPFVAQ
jgi:outer membrane autotransporter protein